MKWDIFLRRSQIGLGGNYLILPIGALSVAASPYYVQRVPFTTLPFSALRVFGC
jgi:hypothetical protein